MKLFEYQSVKLLAQYGIPVPRGEAAETPPEAAGIAARFGGRCVIKAQVLSGGRGKAGGIRVVSSEKEAFVAAEKILAMTIGGYPVTKVLVAELVDLRREFYAGCAVNRAMKRAEFIFSGAGGIDIEETASAYPDKIRRVPLDASGGIGRLPLEEALGPSIGRGMLLDKALSVAWKMERLFSEKDCLLLEVNPLGETVDGRLVAVDAKIIIDDNALAKHPELERLRNPEEYSRDEMDARAAGLSFVGLDGDIGCMVNGAGLAMATMDLIKHFGGRPANFLDIGGSSSPQKVVDAIAILLRNRNIRAILMNIFGGITRCDDVAKGVILAKRMIDIPVPFVIRLIGTNDEIARKLLADEGITAYSDLNEAVRSAVASAGMGGAS